MLSERIYLNIQPIGAMHQYGPRPPIAWVFELCYETSGRIFWKGDMPFARFCKHMYRTQMYFHASSGIWSTAPVFERYV